jgi:DNA-binding response OmpR family regulator
MQKRAQIVEQIEKEGYWPRKVSWRIPAVYDELEVNAALHEVLEQNGFIVDSYENPLLALEDFKAHSHDLVILDIKMPQMNSFSLYRAIKKIDNNLKICFIIAEEKYYGVYSDIFSSRPANCFMRRPIDKQELMNRINEVIVDHTTIDSKQVK